MVGNVFREAVGRVLSGGPVVLGISGGWGLGLRMQTAACLLAAVSIGAWQLAQPHARV